MVILTIETTGQLASAAIYEDGRITERTGGRKLSHLQEIAPMI